MPDIIIIIPAYNEGNVISLVVSDIEAALAHAGLDAVSQILVVNDASKDNTATEAAEAGATVISHILNQGVGGALATGIAYAKATNATIAVTMDGDGQHLAEDVIRGIEIMRGNNIPDLLIGSRMLPGVIDDMPKEKQIGNWGLTFITNMLFFTHVTDSQSGLRLFSRRAIEQIFWRASDYSFNSEVIYRARKLDLSINEYPIQAIYTDYSVSRGQNNWNALSIISSLLSRRIVEIMR